MAIADDISVSYAGNIRWVGGSVASTQYSVLELIRYLGVLADDAQAAGDDQHDITRDTAYERSTDAIVTLNSPYNIDDTLAQHLYGGSITQASGDTVYSGLQVVGTVDNVTTELQIIQNKVALASYWGTGLNANAGLSILSRQLVKTRVSGADIDGKRIRVQARSYGDTYAEFSVTMGLGEAVAAILTNEDLNSTTALATVAGWTTISNTEGYQTIDLGNGAGARPYYSEWNRDTYTINQLYERAKWITTKAPTEDTHTGTGKDNVLGNGTITRQGQSFTVGSNSVYLRRARFSLKVGAGAPTGNITATLYAHSGTYGTSSVGTGAALATSQVIPATRLRSSYDVLEFVFDTPVLLTASTYYVIAVECTGDVSNYVHVNGVDATGHSGNRADYSGSWTADATDDLYFVVETSFQIHSMPGELFRGITHQWDYDNEASGPFTEDEQLSWGTGATAGTGVLIALLDSGATGTMWIQLTSGVAPTNGLQITGGSSSATCDVDGSVTGRTLSPCFLGQSTGTALIGAFGIGVESADLTSNDKLFDLTNTQQIPPNLVTWILSGVVSAEDRILVGPKDTGDAFEWDQLVLNTTLSGGAETAIVCTTTIPSDTPATGTLRIELDNGTRRLVSYTSYTSATFTIAPTDFSGANQATAGNDIMVTYIDKIAAATSEQFQAIFASTRDLRIRVRDGGGTPIKTYEANSTLTSAGGSASAIRTSDA